MFKETHRTKECCYLDIYQSLFKYIFTALNETNDLPFYQIHLEIRILFPYVEVGNLINYQQNDPLTFQIEAYQGLFYCVLQSVCFHISYLNL